MSTRKISIAIGVLFIVQMITAMIGSSLTQAFTDGNSDRASLTIGVLFMLVSGLSVVGIGVLAYQVLKAFNKKLAIWYPVMRVVELTVSTVCGVYLLATSQAVPNHMLLIYIPTAIGGLIFTYLLLRSKVVPAWIAVLGLVGYGLFGLGTALNFMGVVDLNAGFGMILLVPGGLFEVLVLPIWLIAKGFRLPPVAARQA
jgi:hypothetical protein